MERGLLVAFIIVTTFVVLVVLAAIRRREPESPGQARGGHRAARVLAVFILLPLAAVLLPMVLSTDDTQAQDPFTVHISPTPVAAGVNFTSMFNNTYSGVKEELLGYEADGGEVTLVFTSTSIEQKLKGLPELVGEADTAFLRYDDTNFDLTVIFQSQLFGQDLQVLVSARWPNSEEFVTELAVVVRAESLDLGEVNEAWDAFPVRFQKALVGWANSDQTLVPNDALGTGTFFDDGLATTSPDSFHILPGGAALQAVLKDEPNNADPLLEAAGVLGAVDSIVLRGTVGTGMAPEGDPDKSTTGMDITAAVTVATPTELGASGITLDTTWALQITADGAGAYFGRLSGSAAFEMGETSANFGAALSINHNTATSTTTFKFEGTISNYDDVLGQTWLDLTQLKVVVDITRSGNPVTTSYGITITSKLVVGPVDTVATIRVKSSATEKEVSISLGVTGPVTISSILTAVGAPSLPDSAWDVGLNNFGLHISYKKPATSPATVAVAATGSASLLGRTCGTTNYPAGTAQFLFRLQTGGPAPSTTNFFAGATIEGLDVKNLSCDIPFQWGLPKVMLIAANTALNTPWAGVDLPTKTFFENYFCGPSGVGAPVPCEPLQRLLCNPGVPVPCNPPATAPLTLRVAQGLNVRASANIDADLKEKLSALSIEVEGALLVTGTLPILGGTDFALDLQLPTVASPADGAVDSADVRMKLTSSPTEGFAAELEGVMGFRISRPNQASCDDEDDATPEPSGTYSDGSCYDVLGFSIAFSIETTVEPPSVSITGSVFLSNWVNAFGEPTLVITQLALGLEVKTGPDGLEVIFAMNGMLKIGDKDLTLSIKLAASPTPPRILLKGFTFGTSSGISLREIVQTFAPDMEEEALPPALSIKNIWFSFGVENDVAFCIKQGLFISAELHLNDPNPAGSGINPICGGVDLPVPDCGEGSCLAAIRLEITKTRFFLNGQIGAADIGPIAFGGLDVLIDLSLTKQEISFEGSATLYDPVDYFATGNRTTVWASGYLDIEIKQNLGVFSLKLTGCALIGGTAVADENCTVSEATLLQAFINGTVSADFTKLGPEFLESASVDFTVSLSAPALAQLMQDLEEELQPVADFFNDAGTALEGTATDVIDTIESTFCTAFDADCPELQVAADAYDDAPSYIQAQIDATDAAIRDSAAVNFYCFATFDWPVPDCVQDYRNSAKTANNNAIAAAGGAAYIALHGIDRQGFGGIVDADFPDVVYVNATHFKWPAAGTPAPCAAGGELEGLSPCSAAPGTPVNLDDLTGPALLNALEELDPTLAALFASGQAGSSQVASGQFAQQSSFSNADFIADVKKLGLKFDMSNPLAICEAKTQYKWVNFLEGNKPNEVDLKAKVDAYGGKAVIDIPVTAGSGNTAEVDHEATKLSTINELLATDLSVLDCPTGAEEPTEAALTFAMSATELTEGQALTLTGTAPASASVTVSWGEESQTTTVTAGTDGAWQAAYTYKDGPAMRLVSATAGGFTVAGFVKVTNVAPSAPVLSGGTSVNEGDSYTLTGTFSDAGIRDTHTAAVTWGDGTSSQVSIDANTGSFSATHTFVDDNPTLTPEDTHAVSVVLTDKDGASSTASTSVVVKNVAPSELQFTATTSSLGTGDFDEDGNPIVPEGLVVTFSGTFRDPGIADTHSVQALWGDGGFSSVSQHVRDPIDPSLWHFTFTHVFADDHPATGTPSDLFQMGLYVSDDDSGSLGAEPSARILNLAPALSVDPATQDVQYSDPIAEIVLSADDVRGLLDAGGAVSETLAASTRWRVDGGAWQDGLPPDLTMASGGCVPTGDQESAAARQTCTWAVNGIANTAPGVYTIEFIVVDDDTGESRITADIVVLPEDARVDYIGPTILSAPSVLSGSINVELRAMVRDISVVPGIEPPDTNPGDITNATVTFVNRATGAALCTAQVVVAFTGDMTTGVAICQATLPTPGSGQSWNFEVGMVVGGWYTRDDAADNADLLVRRPNGDELHGNHHLTSVGPAGTTGPTAGTRIDGRAHQVKFGQGFQSISTGIEIEFTSGGRKYQAVVTSVDSLGLQKNSAPGQNLAEVEARVTLYDITDSKNKLTVGTGLRLQLRYVDFHAPSTPDTMAFIIWDPSGLIVAAAHWDVVSLHGIVLGGGQIQVK